MGRQLSSGLPYVGTGKKKRKKRRATKWADAKAFSKTSLRFVPAAEPGAEDDPSAEPTDVRMNARIVSDNDLFDAAKAARKRIEAGKLGRVGGKFKRIPGEIRATRYLSSLRLDFVSAEILKLHADQRRVHMSVLISDILNAWLADATDYRQALYRAILPPGVRAAPVPERYVGYLASIGVRTLAGYEQPLEDEPEPEPLMPPPPPPPVETFHVEPPPEPVAEVVVPPPVLEEPRASIGWGSAAAAYTIGMQPGRGGPVETMLEPTSDERAAELREETRKSRQELGIVDG